MRSNLEYRPEIDTLRAISVFAVIIYHAGFYDKLFFPGGYLGVDIFFVISGYLISKLISSFESGIKISLSWIMSKLEFRFVDIAIFLGEINN
mgnify:CR=1 FL=1